ncbi:hypothetical protein D3C80_1384120 [compost metagenome]
MGTHLHHRSNLFGGQHGADRETAAQRFGGGEDIRRHAIVHIGKQFAAAPHAALHFVEYQQCLVFVAQFTHALEEFGINRSNAPFALDWLHHHRTGMVVHHCFHRRQIVERHVHNVGRFWPKTIRILGLPTHRDGEQRAPMESVIKRDNFGFIRTVAGNGVMTRQFEGRFVSLCAGVGKKYPVGKGGVDQLGGQPQRRLVSKNVAGMPQGFALLFQRFDQSRVTVP